MIKFWRKGMTMFGMVLLSLVGMKTSTLANPSSLPSAEIQIGQEECTEPEDYARVVTESDPVNVRSRPDGNVIGNIPKGWAVVVQGKDPTGQWTRVTSHFGDIGNYGFAEAPNFRSGWVSTRFLRPLGRFCSKPLSSVKMLSQLFAQETILVQEDWTQRGDRLHRLN